jgi:hypothetical protein
MPCIASGERTSLPGAVRPEQRDDGASLHAQVERVDGGEVAEALRQALGFDRGGAGV